ncbi:hypothetical protein [Flavobacterium sp.]|uniref:hypothetical protein n=1 Tax=Flavobacterium sp. TaxID=239 RepID=UPI003919E29F
MLSTAKIQTIASNLTALIRQPIFDSSELILEELANVKTEEEFNRVHNIFGLMRINRFTPFRDLTQWLKMELSEEQFERTMKKFNT